MASVTATSISANASEPPPSEPKTVGEAFTAEVLTDVRLQHPDIFSDANLSEAGVLTIETTEVLRPDDELATKLVEAGDSVQLVVVDGPTDEAKRAAIEVVTETFYDQPGVGAGIVTYDETTEQIVASYTPTKEANVTFGPSEVPGTPVGTLSRSEVPGIPVVYEKSEVAPPKATLLSGGTQLTGAGTNQLACTAAFTGTRAGKVGLITADHCPDVMGYESRPILSYQTSATRSRGDAQFHAGQNETIWNRFIVDAPNYQPVLKEIRRASFTDKGYNVCVYGQTTLRTQCVRVIDVRATIIYGSPTNKTYGNMVVTSTRADSGPALQPGDSGGPWWLLDDVSAGVGVTSGAGGYDANGIKCFDRCSYYSDLISVSSDMGVTLKTN